MKYDKATHAMLELVESITHQHHKRLDGASIAVLTKEKASKSKGKTILATASLVPSKVEPILDDEYHFMIVIGRDRWETLEDAQRRALIDHELCHCVMDGDAPKMRNHDYEEFAEIIARHGFWREDAGEQMIQQALLTQGVKIGTLKTKAASKAAVTVVK